MRRGGEGKVYHEGEREHFCFVWKKRREGWKLRPILETQMEVEGWEREEEKRSEGESDSSIGRRRRAG